MLSDAIKYVVLKAVVVLIYVVSHLYDYLFYPVYLVAQHPWRVGRYKRAIHARREDVDDAIVFHSLVEPSEKNVEMRRNGLDTMDKVFAHVSQKHADADCLGTRSVVSVDNEMQPNGKTFQKLVLGAYEFKSFSQFAKEATDFGRGLRLMGVGSKDRVAILAETRADWIIAAYGCFQNNITIVTLYTNLGNDGVAHAINETEVECLICSMETLPKVKAVQSKCKSGTLKRIIVMEALTPVVETSGWPAMPSSEVVMFGQVIRDGATATSAPPRCPPTENDCAIIMYTSGSTGNPKGVMLSHKNLVAAMSALVNIGKFKPKDRYIGYLPLAHVLELLAEATCLLYGIKIGYSSPNTLTNKSSKIKAGSKGDANVLRPTLMCAVPLILERVYTSVVDTMKRQGWAAEELFHYFMAYKMKWQDRGFDTPLLNKTLFRKIRYFLGGRVRLMLSGGAPLSPDTHSLTRTCICVPVMQGYGLTETTACASVTSQYDRTTGRVGAPLMNVRIKIVSWEEGNYLITDKPHPRGEIHVGGDNVAIGYYKNQAKTDEDFYDEDGRRWFRTGDIGEVHDDGVIKIIDRKKDLVKLQHGEYVSYGKVEAVLKTCPIVENVCLYAEPDKDYLIAIVVPDKTHLGEFAGSDYKGDVKAALANKEVQAKILKAVAAYGLKNALEKFELPGKVLLYNDEWTPDSGLVTAAFKIRRRQIVDFYRDDINKVYI